MEQNPEELGVGRLFWVMSDAVVGVDLGSEQIVLWNPAAEALFGYSATEALGMSLVTLVPEEMRSAHLLGIRRYRETGEATLVGGPAVEVPAITKGGDRREIALTLADVSLEPDRRQVVAVIRDMTPFRHVQRELERVNGSMREFVATASHDLRTPLASVLGFARALGSHRDTMSDDQARVCTEAILRGALHASQLVDDLLTLSQIEANMLPLRAIPVRLDEVAREAARIADVEAEIAVDGSHVVSADAHHLQRILVNYLVNAVSHGAPPIRVEANRWDDLIELSVIDHGPGVPDDFVSRLFDSFARADASERTGTGLGLSIARGIAQAHGGDASYRRADTGGACFSVTLPAARAGR